MFKKTNLLLIVLALSFSLYPINKAFSGLAFSTTFPTTDFVANGAALVAFFDLRNRESFVQFTNVDNEDEILHIQIFNVDQNCNENDFFDAFTPNDTHTYNLRDILTNDGNPSGVLLPDKAYGFVAMVPVLGAGDIIGNFRIIDENGYEYRTNIQVNSASTTSSGASASFGNYHFNFNQRAGITFSDIVGITINTVKGGVVASNPIEDFQLLDIDIVNNNEDIFSCRNVIFACVDEDNPRVEELLEFVANNTQGSASVASFEYGINNAIPHSKGGEPLCPGNNIGEGIVNLNQISLNSTAFGTRFFAYVGLNNGNGRGSMDSIFTDNRCLVTPSVCED